MLLANRSASSRALTSAALIALFLIVFCNYYIWKRNSASQFFTQYTQSQVSLASTEASVSKSGASAVTVFVTEPAITPAQGFVTVTQKITETATATFFQTANAVPIPTGIPEKLWYKLGPKGLSVDSRKWIDSCLEKNPTYRHEFLTDIMGDYYVKSRFSSRPDIVDTYLHLPIPILKADFLRYLILFTEGGIWNDLDVSCEDVSMSDWIPQTKKEETEIVVGLEFDWSFEDDGFLHSQWASWTIMARPGSDHMAQVIEDIMTGIEEKARAHDTTISGLTYEMIGDVVDLTGPKRMTRSIVKSMEWRLETHLDDRNLSGLLEPTLLAGVLMLPGNAFAANQNKFPEDQGPKLVTHHYAGTWKNENGGEMA